MTEYRIPIGHDTVIVNEQNRIIRTYKYVKPVEPPKPMPQIPLALPKHDQ
jgi:hypothetical protein